MIIITCPECLGDGTVECEIAVPQSSGNPYGFFDSNITTCNNCDGAGLIEGWEDDEDWDDEQ